MESIIVSRHPAAIEFIAKSLASLAGSDFRGEVYLDEGFVEIQCPNDRLPPEDGWLEVERIPILASATADDVRDKIVYGNLPLHLAAKAAVVVVVEFSGHPPRGAEYTLADMIAAGAHLVRYGVMPLPASVEDFGDYLYSDGYLPPSLWRK